MGDSSEIRRQRGWNGPRPLYLVQAGVGKRRPRAVFLDMKAILLSLFYIIVCGGVGGVFAWWFVGWVGLAGVAGALAAAAVGMIVSVAAFVALTTLDRALRGEPK
jgi:hypothetical protein